MKENGEIKKMRKCGKEKNRKTEKQKNRKAATTWQGTIHGSVPETM